MDGVFQLPEHAQQLAHEMVCHLDNYAIERNTPFVIYGARIFQDGNMWCALLGETIQNGVCAFGETPAKAVQEFNRAWYQTVAETYPPKTTECNSPTIYSACGEQEKPKTQAELFPYAPTPPM